MGSIYLVSRDACISIWLILFTISCVAQDGDYQWEYLFNGEDISDWDTYIGPAFQGGEWSKGPVLGLNNDPEEVFSVSNIEGEAVIHISGKRFGGLSTQREFSNYHLQVQFKWGEKKYPPKENGPRDSGLLYHAVGDHGADGGFWMRSQEFQIQEGDTGDYWGCAGATFDIPVRVEEDNFIYDPQGDLLHFSPAIDRGRHAVKSKDAENPSGEWNTIDLYCFDGTAIHVINGQKNMALYNSSQIEENGNEIPLTRGKIQLQSEGAEVFYKEIRIRTISELPVELLN